MRQCHEDHALSTSPLSHSLAMLKPLPVYVSFLKRIAVYDQEKGLIINPRGSRILDKGIETPNHGLEPLYICKCKYQWEQTICEHEVPTVLHSPPIGSKLRGRAISRHHQHICDGYLSWSAESHSQETCEKQHARQYSYVA